MLRRPWLPCVLLLLLSCSESNPLDEAETAQAVAISANVYRLGAANLEAAQASQSPLGVMPPRWLSRHLGVTIWGGDLAQRPKVRVPSYGTLSAGGGGYAHTAGAALVKSPGWLGYRAVAAGDANGGPAVVNDWSVYPGGIDHQPDKSGSESCESVQGYIDESTPFPNPPAGGAVIPGVLNNGLDYYFVSNMTVQALGQIGVLARGHVGPGINDSYVSCDGGGIQPPTAVGNNVLSLGANSFALMTPWVDSYSGNDYVYTVDSKGHIFYYPHSGNPIDSGMQIGSNNGVSMSSPVLYNNNIWIGDDDGLLWKIPLVSGVPQIGSNAVSRDLCSIAACCANGNKAVSVPFVDVTPNHEHVIVTLENCLMGIDIANFSPSVAIASGQRGGWGNGYTATAPTVDVAGGNAYFMVHQPGEPTVNLLFREGYSGSQTGTNLLASSPSGTNFIPLGANDISPNAPPMLLGSNIYFAAGTFYYRASTDLSDVEIHFNQDTNSSTVVGSPVSDGTYVIFTNDDTIEQQGTIALGNPCEHHSDCFSHYCATTCKVATGDWCPTDPTKCQSGSCSTGHCN